MSRFPAAFRLPAFASRSSDSRWGIGPSLRSAYRPMAGPRRGYHVPHARAATGVGAPSTPRTAVLSRLKSSPWPAPAASQRPVLAPRSNIPSNVPLHEASTGVQAIHPSGLPLACSPPMEREPLGSPPSFEPHRLITGDARRGGDRPRARARNYTLNITSVDPPIRVVHSYACDLVSHDELQESAGPDWHLRRSCICETAPAPPALRPCKSRSRSGTATGTGRIAQASRGGVLS